MCGPVTVDHEPVGCQLPVNPFERVSDSFRHHLIHFAPKQPDAIAGQIGVIDLPAPSCLLDQRHRLRRRWRGRAQAPEAIAPVARTADKGCRKPVELGKWPVRVGDRLDAPVGSAGDDAGADDELGVGDVELVGEEAAR
jgi:hypothetical protein